MHKLGLTFNPQLNHIINSTSDCMLMELRQSKYSYHVPDFKEPERLPELTVEQLNLVSMCYCSYSNVTLHCNI